MVVNLIQFGVDNLDYNTLSNSKRFFVKGFNEFHGLDEDNETGDTQEILVYAIAKSLVSKKESKLNTYLAKVKADKGLIEDDKDLLIGKVQEIQEKQKEELLTIVLKDLFDVDSVAIIDGIDRSKRTDLATVSTTNIKEPKPVKDTTVKTKVASKTIKQKVDVIADFEASLKK